MVAPVSWICTSSILFSFLLAVQAVAQPGQPFLFSAKNSASYDSTGIAQGSLFVVFGANIGPPKLTQATSFPLPTQVGGTSISVTSRSATLVCPMVYSVDGQAAAILPSNTPLGTATLNLTYNGAQSPFPATIEVVPASTGLYTLSSSGLGPGVFTSPDNSVKTFSTSAKPGEVITAWATGLGAINGPDNMLPQTFPNFPGVEVFVGTQSAKVVYAGRSGCCSGVDQISFEVPAGLTGCYQPVVVRSGGKLSNFVTIASSGTGAICSDTAPTLPITVVNRAIAGQTINTAAISIGPISVLRGIGFNQRQFIANRLSKLLGVKVSPQDADVLLRAMQTKNQRVIARAMLKYASVWKGMDGTAKAAVRAQFSLTQEGAVAAFGRYSTAATLASAVGGIFPSQGSCSVTPAAGSVTSSAKGLDAGAMLTLTGQVGTWTLPPAHAGEYQVTFGASPAGPNVPPGSYVVNGSGGKDVGAFSATLNVGGNIVWSNKDSIATVDRSQPLTVTWSGGTSPGYVLLGGYSETDTQGPIAFMCAEDVRKGSFTVPSFILSAMHPTAKRGVIFIGPHPLSKQLAIPGIDFAAFVDASSDSKSVGYR